MGKPLSTYDDEMLEYHPNEQQRTHSMSVVNRAKSFVAASLKQPWLKSSVVDDVLRTTIAPKSSIPVMLLGFCKLESRYFLLFKINFSKLWEVHDCKACDSEQRIFDR